MQTPPSRESNRSKAPKPSAAPPTTKRASFRRESTNRLALHQRGRQRGVVDTEVAEPGAWFDVNVARAGELFMKALWIQGQMCDLLIFKERPDLVEPFLATAKTMPSEFVRLRADRWETADFEPTKGAFVEEFSSLIAEGDRRDLDFLSALRNAIAHSHVSIGRDYFLYRPRTKKEAAVIQGMALQPRAGAADPPMLKLAFFHDPYYLDCFDRIKRLDEVCLPRVALSLGVQHSRIR